MNGISRAKALPGFPAEQGLLVAAELPAIEGRT